MNFVTPIKTLVVSAAVGFSWPSMAFAEADTEHRHHRAHEHGHLELNIVLEKNIMQIMLQSPGISIVGFEHAPENDSEKNTLLAAIETLKQGQNIFQPPAGAKCSLTQAEVDTELLEGDHANESDKDEGKDEHADFLVQYTFNCEQPSALTSITVRLFELFPAIEEIDGQLVTEVTQKGFELSASDTIIQL
jgi:hypothetical protein